MTELLEKGIKAVQDLPTDRQDMVGSLLLEIAGMTSSKYSLTAEQIEDLKIGIAEADRGEYASDAEMVETWAKFDR